MSGIEKYVERAMGGFGFSVLGEAIGIREAGEAHVGNRGDAQRTAQDMFFAAAGFGGKERSALSAQKNLQELRGAVKMVESGVGNRTVVVQERAPEPMHHPRHHVDRGYGHHRNHFEPGRPGRGFEARIEDAYEQGYVDGHQDGVGRGYASGYVHGRIDESRYPSLHPRMPFAPMGPMWGDPWGTGILCH